jgi:hypothetical protein
VGATRLKYGEFYADVVSDRLGSESFWIYVVQRHGSPEILAMGSCASEELAIQTAADAINDARDRSAKSQAAS